MHNLLNEIATTVIGASLAGLLCHYLRQPIILGYVLAGVVIGGNFGLGLVEDPHTIEIISELGLILLLYIIGLEINLGKLLSSGKQLLLTATSQFPLCVGLAFIFFSFFTLPVSYISGSLELVYLGIFCALSSTAIVVKGLYDKGEIDTLPGRMTIGTLIFQDIYAILVLAIQPNLGHPELKPVALAIGSTILLLALGFLFSKHVLSKLFHSIAKSPEMVVSISLAWCTLMAGLADALHVSREMGALVAGLAISAFPYSIHITAKTLPLRDFFLTLFFVSLGMKLALPEGAIVGPILLISAFIFISRFLTIYPILYFTKSGRRASFVTSLNLAQISEFALVIASIGLSLGHIRQELVSLLVLSMVLLSLVSSYCIRFSHEIFLIFNRTLNLVRQEKGASLSRPDSASSHELVFVGFHRGAMALLDLIEKDYPKLAKKILVIDFNPVTILNLEQRGITTIFGDISSYDTLSHAHVSSAKIIVSTIPDMIIKGTNNRELLRMLKSITPHAKVISTATDKIHKEELKSEGADIVLLPDEITASWLAPLLQNKLAKEVGYEVHEEEISEFDQLVGNLK